MIKMVVELDDDTLALLMEAKKSLSGLGNYDTLDSVIKELCNVYFWRGE